MGISVSGVAAELRWGYHRAATLGSWTLVDGVLTATIKSVDAYGVSQSPLTLVAGSLRRPIEGLQITAGTLTARLGPEGVSHGREMQVRST